MSTNCSKQNGFLLVLVLVFGGIFFLMVSAFIGYVVTQNQLIHTKIAKEKALFIAESGLNYYRWYLAHFPGDTTNGTTTPGPYVHTYTDPEGGPIGEFSLEIASSTACGEIYAVDITSTGYTFEKPNAKRIVHGRYARPTVAEFAFIINSNVWAGPDRVIVGPYHSNGIIRMDGTNNSTVTSGQENWVCDNGQLSCDPPHNEGEMLDAVFGVGPNSNLWSFPAPPINFTGLTVDLAAMQEKAENGGGIFFPPSPDYGYHIIFQPDGTFDVYNVRRKENEPNGYAWGQQMNILKNTHFIGSYDIPQSCSVIYVEDQIWLEGEVNGKVTIAAADVDTTGEDPSIILNDNITYANEDSGVLVIAENDILIGLVVPDDMELNGIFMAQNGHFGRNHYNTSMPNAWEQYIMRNSLTINGTIVSNGRVGTKWVCGSSAEYCSGFETRYNYYDRNLVADPPPLTPETSDTYRFIEWREVE